MWAATLSLPSPISANCKTHKNKCINFRLRASLFDYPLASRIFVRNLPFSTKESCLQKEFANFGQIAEVKLVKDEFTKRSKGYAFIQYTSQDDAMLAIENMDQQVFDGRLIYVEIAKPGKERLGGYPKTSGPPRTKQDLLETNDLADCWY
ncbi:cold-inducible RNA-binding protein A [Durio zibethinus]|uniref:Cold-inducible RNA-binding protein A n=1 Tax=Durio zibethinus TaxID=66656 RepID=A0A6P6ABB9_DURZI|nr:cold-inducible RNA-binding protein A [Durio zibethinus]